jgi:hypothetical protein
VVRVAKAMFLYLLPSGPLLLVISMKNIGQKITTWDKFVLHLSPASTIFGVQSFGKYP